MKTITRTVTRALTLGAVGLGILALSGCDTDLNAVLTNISQDPTVTAAQATRSTNAPSDDLLANLRECESHGDYKAVSGRGTYRGAYQFSQRTWDRVVRTFMPTQVGVDPAAAAAFIQDAAARKLWAASGPSSWPVCGPRAA